MDNRITNMIEFKTWNRKIMNAFWAISIIYLIGQLLFLLVDILQDPSYSVGRYLIKYMLVPDSIVILVLLCTELLFKYYGKFEKYLIMVTSIIIFYTAFFNINSTISGRQLVLIMPVLLSIFYFNKKILMITSLIDLLVVWIVYLALPYKVVSMTIFELIIVTFGIISAGVIGIGIVNRGMQLLDLITNLVKNEEKLIIEKSIIDKLSKTDALTGLYNHRIFHEYVDTILNQRTVYNFQIQLALIDIDDFKKVNDTYGHWYGDIVLKEVGKVIHDAVTADDFVSRYGGEEFTIIFIGKNFTDTLDILEKIRKSIENITFKEMDNKHVTVSAGVHHCFNNEGKELMFKYADTALYKAKNSGKNKIVCSP